MLVNCPVDTMPASSRPQSSAYLTNARPIKCQGKWHLTLVEQLLGLCTPWTFQKKQATAHELNHLPGKCWMLDKPRDIRWRRRDMKWIYTLTMDKVTFKMIWNDTTVCQTPVSQHVKTSLPDSCVANPYHAMGIGNLFQRPTGKIQSAFNNTLCDNGFNLKGATWTKHVCILTVSRKYLRILIYGLLLLLVEFVCIDLWWPLPY